MKLFHSRKKGKDVDKTKAVLFWLLVGISGCSDAAPAKVAEPDVIFATADISDALLDHGMLDTRTSDARVDSLVNDTENQTDEKEIGKQDSGYDSHADVSTDTNSTDGFACKSDEECSNTPLSDTCMEGVCEDGVCTTKILPDGAFCSTDNIQCQVCMWGACQEDMLAPLSDNNPCSKDICEKGQVKHVLLNGPQCDDGDACTTDDTCIFGTCTGGLPLPCTKEACASSVSCQSGTCVQVWSPPGTACDDGDACTADDACDGIHTCTGEAITCNDGNPCTDEYCDSANSCYAQNNANSCDDGSACTKNDYCASGTCHSGVLIECNDADVCNGTESCDASTGCVSGDPLDCDDDDPCTIDACHAADGCTHSPNPACVCETNAQCDDGNACNGAESCDMATFICLPGTSLSCDDGNPCNGTESCDAAAGCQAGTAPIVDDGISCTMDACDETSGVVHTPVHVLCTDENPCTDGLCNTESGCVFVPNSNACDDNNACTDSDACMGGVCASGAPVICEDENACTDNTCDPLLGCVFIENSAPCDDGNACTATDICENGDCMGNTPVVCQALDQCHDAGICDPDTGLCSNPPLSDGSGCDDSNICTEGDHCESGSCISGIPLDCSDGDPCNGEETCDLDAGCQAGEPIACDDNDPCTMDSCDPATGACVFEPDACVAFVPGGPYMDSPTTSTTVGPFWIDKIEVRVRDYTDCVNANSCSEPIPNPEPGCSWGIFGKDNHPMNCLNYIQMGDYCSVRGGRLPTRHEWKKAARGGCEINGNPACEALDYHVYPWGDSIPTCNEAVFKDAVIGNGCGLETTWVVGSKPNGNSPYGLTDVAGNISEVNTEICPQNEEMMICGGNYTSSQSFLEIDNCLCIGPIHQTYGNKRISFRCVYDSKPSWAP